MSNKPYSSKKDFIEINGLLFSNVLDGDFSPERTGDKWIREMDNQGKYFDFENPDNSCETTLIVRPDATQFLKELRRLMENGEYFTLVRDNRNPGGQKEVYTGCLVVNDGSAGKNKDGNIGRREWKISAEDYNVVEGKN